MLEQIKKDKIQKLENFKKNGINPFPSCFFTRDAIISAINKPLNSLVQLTGRIVLKREMGNICFFHLQDQSGRMQIVLNKKEFKGVLNLDQNNKDLKVNKIKKEMILDTKNKESEQRKLDLKNDFKFWVKNLDLGDFIGISGERFDTQKGEKSVLVKKITLLSKSILPLPDKFKGLEDEEKRQRFRELELLSDQNVLKKFQRRFLGLQTIRQFMWQQGFTEIETPILQNVYGGTYAKPFTTHYNVLNFDLYLRIAPEIFLKRSTVGGFEKIFEIARCFRNEGMDPSHLQEFTMFEFYWAYANYEKLMDFTEKMYQKIIEEVYCGNYIITLNKKKINLKPPYPRKTFCELIKEYLKVDFYEIDSSEKILNYVKKNNLEKIVNFKKKPSWASQMDELYKKTIRKKLIQPIFVTDYPKEFMALAKTKNNDPKTVATFQLVINGWEMLKAYNELNDPIDQKKRFEEQKRLKIKGDEEAMPYDSDFIESMEYGMPPMAGWGMGLDRFFALLEGVDNLRDLVLFPTMKPQNKINQKFNTNIAQSISSESENQDPLLNLGINYDQAKKLLKENLKEKVNVLHSLESEFIMRALAKYFQEDEEKWGIIGLLHDIDWEITKNNPQKHCLEAVKILKKAGATDFLIKTIQSHGYGQGFGDDFYGPEEFKNKKRTSKIEHCLASAETVTGLIMASSAVQPDKKLASVKLKSLKKKFKDKKFASGCRREIIKECEKVGLPLDQFLEISLRALQERAKELGA